MTARTRKLSSLSGTGTGPLPCGRPTRSATPPSFGVVSIRARLTASLGSRSNHVTSALGALTLLCCSFGCAAPHSHYQTGDHWSRAEAYGTKSRSGYGEPEELHYDPQARASSSSGTLDRSAEQGGARSGAIGRLRPPVPVNTPVLTGRACLSEMKARNIDFVAISELKGVENPVEVRGLLGGVHYYSTDGRLLQMDCRLALALDDLEDTMKAHGIARIRFSGAYVYRTTRSGRLSHHAHGLAIDLHDFESSKGHYSVKHDFRRNVGCDAGRSRLNELSCSMRSTALFDEFLTPDYNADHHDHLHISVPRRASFETLHLRSDSGPPAANGPSLPEEVALLKP